MTCIAANKPGLICGFLIPDFVKIKANFDKVQ